MFWDSLLSHIITKSESIKSEHYTPNIWSVPSLEDDSHSFDPQLLLFSSNSNVQWCSQTPVTSPNFEPSESNPLSLTPYLFETLLLLSSWFASCCVSQWIEKEVIFSRYHNNAVSYIHTITLLHVSVH
jgi:hypothetical protein